MREDGAHNPHNCELSLISVKHTVKCLFRAITIPRFNDTDYD